MFNKLLRPALFVAALFTSVLFAQDSCLTALRENEEAFIQYQAEESPATLEQFKKTAAAIRESCAYKNQNELIQILVNFAEERARNIQALSRNANLNYRALLWSTKPTTEALLQRQRALFFEKLLRKDEPTREQYSQFLDLLERLIVSQLYQEERLETQDAEVVANLHALQKAKIIEATEILSKLEDPHYQGLAEIFLATAQKQLPTQDLNGYYFRWILDLRMERAIAGMTVTNEELYAFLKETKQDFYNERDHSQGLRDLREKKAQALTQKYLKDLRQQNKGL